MAQFVGAYFLLQNVLQMLIIICNKKLGVYSSSCF